jgi:thiamine pyrophosphate-dependent acetolactate synthase large subunit-like protein
MAEPHAWTSRMRGWLSASGHGDGPDAARAAVAELAERLTAARRPLILAGSGVVADDAVPGLRALAAEARVGVYNTWRAKGVLPWDSDYHLGTIGLQERDVELCELESYDLILTTGLAGGEPPALPDGLPVAECPAAALEILAVRCAGREGPATVEAPLRERLAAVVQKAWGGASPPLAPTLITRQYALLLGDRGMVAADAGTAGFCLGRTFPTLRPRTVELPGVPTPGFAASAVVARREAEPDLPALALVDGVAPDRATAAIVEAAAARGVAVPVVCWSPDGPRVGIEEHLNEVRKAVAAELPTVVTVGYDPAQLAELEHVAGHVTAWRASGFPSQ